jgi:uncharacterized protein (TIGR03435 family)
MKAANLSCAISFCIVGGLFGQPQAFEVASIKPSAPDVPGMFPRYLPGGGLRITGASLKNLISMAYGVRPFQISGGPDWVNNDLFDIEARSGSAEVAPPTDPAKAAEYQRLANERLKTLLADRFQLSVRQETREQPVYALVVAKDGPKFRESTEARPFIRGGRGTVKGQASSMIMLALNLSSALGRPVINKTGLPAKYDFELTWQPGDLNADPTAPSIFTALTEQLGLRLESGKGPVEVLVIDRAEKPSAN